MVNVFDPEKKRTRGFETTGPEAALEVRVFGGGGTAAEKKKVYWWVPSNKRVRPALLKLYTTEPCRVEFFFRHGYGGPKTGKDCGLWGL